MASYIKSNLCNYTFRTQTADDVIFNMVRSGHTALLEVPNKLILSMKYSAPFDQGPINSSVSNAIAMFIYMATDGRISISRILHYYYGRLISKIPRNIDDTGISIDIGTKVLKDYGYCPEADYLYDTKLYTNLPPPAVFRDKNKTFKNISVKYIRQTSDIDVTMNIKMYINMYGSPVMVGLKVYNTFVPSASHRIPMPVGTDTHIGYTVMLIIGYDDTTNEAICLNSWGNSGGNNGVCYIPYTYIQNADLANDFAVFSIVV